jgi:hypothetical protein
MYHIGFSPRMGMLRCGVLARRATVVGDLGGLGRRLSHLVLDSIVAAHWREILRHCVITLEAARRKEASGAGA